MTKARGRLMAQTGQGPLGYVPESQLNWLRGHKVPPRALQPSPNSMLGLGHL